MSTRDYSEEIRKAVRFYWRTKKAAHRKNQSGDRKDAGNRGGATAGKNLDGLTKIFADIAKETGPRSLEIYKNKTQVVLPGHFRPSKQWDLVLIHEGRLIATLELKSLGGPSFGNNANNRCEEALGSGLDLSVAQREGVFGSGADPFVGYCILVEDDAKSRSAPNVETLHLISNRTLFLRPPRIKNACDFSANVWFRNAFTRPPPSLAPLLQRQRPAIIRIFRPAHP